MVTPMFGWSAGDVVVSIRIIIKICEAFNEAGGSTSRYAESTAFLEGFKVTLSKLDAYIRRNPNSEYTAEITQQLKLIDAPYCRFEKFMLDFQPALGTNSNYGRVRKAPGKMKWALKELSAVSGKVAELKKEVCDPLVLVDNLMQLQSLDALQKIAAQISKLPESSHIETMKVALEDAAANILIGIQSHIRDLNQSAQRHSKEIARHSKDLARIADILSNRETSLATSVFEESEKSRQLQVVESVKFIKHVDSVSATLKKKLDAITNALKEQEQLHSMRHESLTENIRSQQLALDQVHDSVEAFAAKAVEIVILLDQKMGKVDDESRARKTWLGQFATQLISSGITSAIAGSVVLVLVRSKLSHSDKLNGCAENAHQQITSAPREGAEAQANVSKTASDPSDPSTDIIKVSSVHISPEIIPSTSLPQSSPSRKRTSSLASLSGHAQSRRQPSSQKTHRDHSEASTVHVPNEDLATTPRSDLYQNANRYPKGTSSALSHRLSQSDNPKRTSETSVGNKSYSRDSITLNDTMRSFSSTRTGAYTSKNTALPSAIFSSSSTSNITASSNVCPLLQGLYTPSSAPQGIWICCSCAFINIAPLETMCLACHRAKCHKCTKV